MFTGKPDRTTAHKLWLAGGFILLGLVCLSPWPFGSVSADWQLVVSFGLFILIGLWATHALYTSRLSYTPDICSSCLLGLVFLAAIQLLPLPEEFVRIFSPATVERHRNLLPEMTELLPGESEATAPSRSGWVRLSASPANTQDMLAELLALFLVYATARNFVAFLSPKDSLQQLAWVAFATGVALALLALLQTLSGDHTRVFWMFPVGSRPYGPFVNKNHFAFQINLFMGLTGGLFITVAHQRGWRSPMGLGLLGGLGLMVTALAFSESRGGIIAAVASAVVVGLLAWLRGKSQQHQSETQAGLVLALGVIVVAGGLIAWLGVHTVVDRIATLWGGNADNRSADWRSVWPLVERFPLTGVGAGALAVAEPSVRTRSDITYVFNTLDNEYLEALVEGGIVRLMLTLGLGLSAVLVSLRGYRRTGDPLLLGCAFGLIAVGFQSAGDFGLHTTSVALTASVVVAFATARGRKPEAVTHRSGSDGPRRGEWVFKDGSAYFAAGLLLFAGVALVLAEWRTYRATEYREVATILLRSGLPGSRDDAIRLLEVATRIRPDDPAAWELLMVSHLAAALDQHQRVSSAVTGCVVFVDLAEMLPTSDSSGHLAATLRAARNLRDRQNLSPMAHLTLGTFANQFARSEPGAAHFARAKSIAGYDPDVWYQSGRGAANQGDWVAATSDWRESLIRSRKRLAPIVWQARSHLSPEELRARVLPDDPEVWLAATPFAFAISDHEGRTGWFRAVADRFAANEPTTLSGFVAWSTALDKLGDVSTSLRLWRRAVERFPEEVLARDKFADALADGEYYEEAIPVLEWLIARQPERNEYRDRLAAAHHALKLKAEINAP
ncbi:MAG: hypothetical protein C0467_25655 [Planctomycetaceae bacterium]|nr:hypothetical protein [Planctomycetaceae bacterium]